MKLAIVGSRTDVTLLNLDVMIQYIPQNCSCIVSGGANGVDKLAEIAAEYLDIPIKKFLPDYAAYGKRAPLIRNHLIADYCDYLVAFWDFHSTGTAHILAYCIDKTIPFHIIPLSELRTD